VSGALRTGARTGAWAAFAFCVTLLAAVALPNAIGMHSFTVMSGSMEPAIHTGDVVIDSKIAPLAARPGDVVTFSDPSGLRRLITHRVRSIHARGSSVEVVTKGDANNTVERWTVPVRGRIGRVELRVPRLGYPLVYAHSRLGLVLLVAVPALLLCVLELRRIRTSGEEKADAAAA
jgi:signal peptidase